MQQQDNETRTNRAVGESRARPQTWFGPGRRGFSVVELSVAVVIIALIATTLIYVFRSNLSTWQWGTAHMGFNAKVQLTMKQVFTDIKAIGPAIGVDQNGTLYFQGEKIGDMQPNLVQILDLPSDTASEGRRVEFGLYDLNNPGQRTKVAYYLDSAQPSEPPTRLIREVTDYNNTVRKKVVAERVTNLFFQRNPADIQELRIRMDIGDDENATLREHLAFAVHLDTNLVCVK